MDVSDPHFYSDTAPAPMKVPKPPKEDAAEEADAKDAEAAPPATAVPTLEAEVQQLVGSIGSWWSGVSKKSQETISSARAQIESQGGLVAMAKAEAARFESQLNEAQRAAREAVQKPLDEGVATAGAGAKGKARANDEDESLEAEQHRDPRKGEYSEEGEALPIPRTRSSGDVKPASKSDVPAEHGTSLFDADAPNAPTSPRVGDIDIAQAASAALGSAQAWFTRMQGTLASEPRVQELQRSLASTLQSARSAAANVASPTSPDLEGATTTNADGSQRVAPLATALPALSKTIQAAIPHLDWKQSQELAKRYYAASESMAKDLGKEMSSLANEMVRIVPGNEEGAESGLGVKMEGEKSKEKEVKPTTEPASSSSKAAVSSVEVKDDFDWDSDAEASAAAAAAASRTIDPETLGLQTTTGPQTSSWDGEASPRKPAPASKSRAVSAGKDQDSDADSDWE